MKGRSATPLATPIRLPSAATTCPAPLRSVLLRATWACSARRSLPPTRSFFTPPSPAPPIERRSHRGPTRSRRTASAAGSPAVRSVRPRAVSSESAGPDCVRMNPGQQWRRIPFCCPRSPTSASELAPPGPGRPGFKGSSCVDIAGFCQPLPHTGRQPPLFVHGRSGRRSGRAPRSCNPARVTAPILNPDSLLRGGAARMATGLSVERDAARGVGAAISAIGGRGCNDSLTPDFSRVRDVRYRCCRCPLSASSPFPHRPLRN